MIEAALESVSFVPCYYPLLLEEEIGSLRRFLIDRGIYVPVLWPELLEAGKLNQYENEFVTRIVNLPIDQRNGPEEMGRIVEVLQEYLGL